MSGNLHPFLSRLNSGPGAPSITEAGVWQSKRHDTVAAIAALTPGGDGSFAQQCRSVPSIWGYAQLFHEAWREARHPLHAEVLSYWRRFLGVVVLRQQLANVPIVITNFALEASGGFVSAALSQLPWALFDRSATPPRVLGVLAADQVIGLGIPGLMVIPARGIVDRDPAARPGDRLSQYLGLQDGEFAAATFVKLWGTKRVADLAAWIDWVLPELVAAMGSVRAPAIETLRDRLQEFREVLRAELAVGVAAPGCTWSTAGEDNLPASLRVLFASPTHVKATLGCGLSPRSDLQVGGDDEACRMALVADSMAAHPEMRELQITANVVVQDLPERDVPAQRRRFYHGDRLLLIRPDDIFASRLVRFDENRMFPFHPRAFQRYLIPLRPFALALLSPDQLEHRLRCQADDNRVVVELDLEVGAAAAPRRVTLQKIYKIGTNLVDAPLPRTFAVWPDYFSSSEIGYNFVFQTEDRDFGAAPQQVTPPITATLPLHRQALASALRRLLAADDAPRDDLGFERLLNAAGERPNFNNVTLFRSGSIVRSLLATEQPIEAAVCDAGATSGLLLLHRRRVDALPEDAQIQTRVAVDFGTTNTTVAIQFGEETALSDLTPHVWLPFSTAATSPQVPGDRGDSGQDIASMAVATEFMPPQGLIASPFLSLVEVRNQIPPQAMPPLTRLRIPYIRDGGLDASIDRLLSSDLPLRHEFGLKWDAGGERREYVRGFLRQIVMQVAAQVRARGGSPGQIDWRFSLPRALDRAIQERFRDEVKQVVKSIAAPNAGQAEKVSFVYESAAVFQYVLGYEPGNAGDVVAILDIGGRSTDIAIMQPRPDQGAGRPAWEGSARLAGETLILDEWVRNRSALIELLTGLEHSPVTRAELEALHGDAAARLRPITEMLLNNDAYARQIWGAQAHAEDAKALLERTRLRGRLMLLGLAWFVIRFALTSLGPRADETGEKDQVAFFLAGRGSRVFRQLCWDAERNRFQDQDLIEQWLDTAGFGSRCTIGFTERPKLEVALGALRRPPPDPSAPGGSAASNTSPESTSGTPSPPPASVPRFQNLRSFVQAVAARFPEFPNLGQAFDPDWSGSISLRQALTGLLADTQPGFEAEPPHQGPGVDPRREFILGLDILLRKHELLAETA